MTENNETAEIEQTETKTETEASKTADVFETLSTAVTASDTDTALTALAELSEMYNTSISQNGALEAENEKLNAKVDAVSKVLSQKFRNSVAVKNDKPIEEDEVANFDDFIRP